MGYIKEEIEISGIFKKKKIYALFDSGAYSNYIRRELGDGETVEDIGYHIFEGQYNVILANGGLAKGERVCFQSLSIKGHKTSNPTFIILNTMTSEVIIGAALMQSLGVTLDFSTDKIEMK